MSTLYEVGPLSLNQLTRDLWGNYDAPVIAMLAEMANDPCYTQKFYKAPADDQELFAAREYKEYGMKVTPGSLIYGVYYPFPVLSGAIASTSNSVFFSPFTVQIHDDSLDHDWFDIPMSCLFLQNYKPTFQGNFTSQPAATGTPFISTGSFPNLLNSPYPVVGSGLFTIQMQEVSGFAQRIELVFGVLEVCG
jgi:hypothetical protein